MQPAADPSPIARAMLDAAGEIGIPTFEHPNGRMMEGEGGAAISDMLVRDGRRHSLYRAYLQPWLDRPNLTVLTGALVRRVIFDGRRVTGVEFLRDGQVTTVGASAEVVLSLGAIQTPKVLMHSGIGDREELERVGIPLLQHLPGVGQNLQDHVSFGCTWEYAEPIAPRNSGSEATLYWKSRPDLDVPDLLFCQVEFPVPSDRTAGARRAGAWVDDVRGACASGQPRAAAAASADPMTPLAVDANFLSDSADLAAARACIKLCRDAGQCAGLSSIRAQRSHAGRREGRSTRPLHP